MKIERSKPRWGLVWLIFIVLGALAALPFFLFKPKVVTLPGYQIQNFVGPVQVYGSQTKKWGPARRGAILTANDKIKVGAAGEIDLFVPDQVNVRIKENSEVEIKNPRSSVKTPAYRLHVIQGLLLGTAHKKKQQQERFEISTPVLAAPLRGTYQIEVDPKTEESVVRMLEGEAQVESLKTKKSVVVKELEQTSVKGKSSPTPPTRVTRKEWDKLKEGYDLFERSPMKETKQVDLAKEAGNLFSDHVFDHGSFFTPNFGFSDREFFTDETLQKVILRVDYDVFPTGSFVGMYMKTRELDLAKVKALEFDARSQAGQGVPDSVRIEFKGEMGVLRVFVPRDFRETWRTYSYPINVREPAAVAEITIVFSNDRAKSHKKGSLYFRNLNFIPQDKPTVSDAMDQQVAALN